MQKVTTPENTPTSANFEADKKSENNLKENLPRPHVLKNILSFSASLKMEDSVHTGKILTHSN